MDAVEVVTWGQSGACRAAAELPNAIALGSDEVQHTADPPHPSHPNPALKGLPPIHAPVGLMGSLKTKAKQLLWTMKNNYN